MLSDYDTKAVEQLAEMPLAECENHFKIGYFRADVGDGVSSVKFVKVFLTNEHRAAVDRLRKSPKV